MATGGDSATLRAFSLGSEVVRLQILLRTAGYRLEPDGIFGSMTRECVKSYQSAHGLPGSGVVDAMTWTMLEEAYLSQNG
ncbi:MAG: peptidoglycan-binding domain-containing protein [Clostridia bacterium]|nr:peptidoglycan-binding domain-containing protein [Clostridia bacterium]